VEQNAQTGIAACIFQCFHTADKFVPTGEILPLRPGLLGLIKAVAIGFF
jgi:hypothetical protein